MTLGKVHGEDAIAHHLIQRIGEGALRQALGGADSLQKAAVVSAFEKHHAGFSGPKLLG